MKKSGNEIGELVGTVIGFAFCFAMAWLFFSLGLVIADWLLGGEHRSEAGLLSAITVIWIYEHQTSQIRWQAMNERLDRQWARRNGLD